MLWVVAHGQLVPGSIFEHAAPSASRTSRSCIVRDSHVFHLFFFFCQRTHPITQAEKAQADGGVRKACVEAVFLSLSAHGSHKFGGGDSKTTKLKSNK